MGQPFCFHGNPNITVLPTLLILSWPSVCVSQASLGYQMFSLKWIQWQIVSLMQSRLFASRAVGQQFDLDRTASAPTKCFSASKPFDGSYCTILDGQGADLCQRFGLLKAFFRVICALCPYKHMKKALCSLVWRPCVLFAHTTRDPEEGL